jgi:hypothetical protein
MGELIEPKHPELSELDLASKIRMRAIKNSLNPLKLNIRQNLKNTKQNSKAKIYDSWKTSR